MSLSWNGPGAGLPCTYTRFADIGGIALRPDLNHRGQNRWLRGVWELTPRCPTARRGSVDHLQRTEIF